MGGGIAEKIAYLNKMGDASLDVIGEIESPPQKIKPKMKDLVNI